MEADIIIPTMISTVNTTVLRARSFLIQGSISRDVDVALSFVVRDALLKDERSNNINKILTVLT